MEPRATFRVSTGASKVITSAPLSFQHHAAVSVFFFFYSTALISHRTSHYSLPILLALLFLYRPPSLLQPDSGHGPLLLAGYEDGSLLLWDVTQRSVLSQAKAHPEPVMCLTFDIKCLRGVSGSSENKLSTWKLDRQNNLQVSRGPAQRIVVLSRVVSPTVLSYQLLHLFTAPHD